MTQHWGNTGEILSHVIGWGYFAAWTISFWPQIWLNWRRKSVVGLSFDYTLFNIIGFVCYTAFNIAFYASPRIRQEYADRNNGKQNLVQINDVVFAVHAVFATLIVIIQIFIYDRGTQKVSRFAWILSGIGVFSIFVMLIVSAAGGLAWIWFFYYLSGVKLAISFIKYCPQVYLNFKRKSTVGWNIWNVLLDFTGGLLSVGQLFFDSWRTGMWM
eukprot:TRINITY_DN7766_c0_g1_i2.p1 TRINITY_DN7766_c0_g1~~TRINITY_DN7766_c0_g1_i2.p1  ORF type:complete len:214 (+),score=28.46 TRINITY_DN7766_c0_g1_i2:52-693(+)